MISARCCSVWKAVAFLLLAAVTAFPTLAQQRREREPNSVYAERRAKLAAQIDAPIVLWGYTGREEVSEASIFAQEENFYYLTGHNEEGAGLIILPAKRASGAAVAASTSSGGSSAAAASASSALPSSTLASSALPSTSSGVASQPSPANSHTDIPQEILFLPAKDPAKEKWNGLRMSPSDPGIEARTGFTSVQNFSDMRAVVERLAPLYTGFYTILVYEKELGGYPHEKQVVDWLQLVAPQAKLKNIRYNIEALREIKSPGELEFLQQAIDLSLDAHVAAMKMMRPGLYEYQIAAKMVEVHAMGGSEGEGYAPIVGAGPNSTALHYDKLSRKIQDGDIVVMDVGAQYSGYSSDITRTIPANGKFTARQREIYDIVLGAQNAALAAMKPGADVCNKGSKSAYRVAYDYINSHGRDLHGKPLGQYFIHGLSHRIGLNVHDPGSSCEPLQPGMVITDEPGIYIPEENLGVRIEDDVLITESGNKLLSARLPRSPDEIEKIMATHSAASDGGQNLGEGGRDGEGEIGRRAGTESGRD